MELATSPKALDTGLASALGLELSEVMKFRMKAAERGFADIRARGLAARRDRTGEAARLLPPLALPISQRKALDMLSVFAKLKPECRQRLKDGFFDMNLPAEEWGEPYVPAEVLNLPLDASLADHMEAILRASLPDGSFYDCEKSLGSRRRLRCEAVFSTSGIARIDFLVDEADEDSRYHVVATSGVRFGDWSTLDMVGLARRKLPPATYVTVTTGSIIEVAEHLAAKA